MTDKQVIASWLTVIIILAVCSVTYFESKAAYSKIAVHSGNQHITVMDIWKQLRNEREFQMECGIAVFIVASLGAILIYFLDTLKK